MDIRELKKGNIFGLKTSTPKYFAFERITESDAIVATEYKGSVGLFAPSNDKLYEGLFFVPFTTEWAERFGLIGKVINGLCISESEYQGHEYDLCLYDEHTWDSERRVICPIYYVHQCQNIFLDLAGHIIE